MRLADKTRDLCRNCNLPVIYYHYHGNRSSSPDSKSSKPFTSTWWHHQSDKRECPEGTEKSRLTSHRWDNIPRAEPKGLCLKDLTSGEYFQKCHRKVKFPEMGLCGIHAKVVLEDRKRIAADDERRNQQEIIREGVLGQIEILKTYGLRPVLHEQIRGGYNTVTGMVLINPEDLLKLCEEVEEQF